MARSPITLSVLRHLDAGQLAEEVRHETRGRQRVLPPISTYRWWARRTEAVSSAVLDALAQDAGGRLLVADPFAGGGVIALCALLGGHQVYAQDVNPWACRSLATMLDLPEPARLSRGADLLGALTAGVVEEAYATTMPDGRVGSVSQTLRVAVATCPSCASDLRLFPGALVSLKERVDNGGGKVGFVACPAGHISTASGVSRSLCSQCRRRVDPAARYTTGRRASCHACGWTGRISELAARGLGWSVVLVDRVGPDGREIGLPSSEEVAQAADTSWTPRLELPEIRPGRETKSLLGLGVSRWHNLYPARQRVVLEALLGACPEAADGDEAVTRALEAAVIGSTEMAGFVSRWDPRYLKAYEAVANHRYNFTTLAVEPNVWGAGEHGRGSVQRRLDLLAKAALWLEERCGGRLRIEGPIESSARRRSMAADTDVRVVVGSSERMCVPKGKFDAIVTDPPYHDDVQYSELSDLFRAWAGCGTGELAGDAVSQGAGEAATEAYEVRLRTIFTEARRALRPGGHLVLSYANRDPRAWTALFGALQAAGFRAVGYAVVASENETDHAKAGRRACNLDVLIDLVGDGDARLRRWRPLGEAATFEEEYCRLLGEWALEIGQLEGDWKLNLTEDLRSTDFLATAADA